MVTHTKRDRVWDVALDLATDGDAFTVAEVSADCGVDDLSKRTVRDVLTTMAELDWLEKRTDPADGSRFYVRGGRLGADAPVELES